MKINIKITEKLTLEKARVSMLNEDPSFVVLNTNEQGPNRMGLFSESKACIRRSKDQKGDCKYSENHKTQCGERNDATQAHSRCVCN